MKVINTKSLLLGLVFFLTISLSAQMHKKPIVSDGKLDSASEALDSAKSSSDTVIESRGTTNTTEATKTTSTTTTTAATTSTTGTVTGSGDAKKGEMTASNTEVFCCINSKAQVEITSKDGETRVDYQEFKVNDGDYKKYNGPFTLADEGNNTITYRSVDIVGNREAAKVMIIVVDNTPPTVNLAPKVAPYVSGNSQIAVPDNTYQISAVDAPAGVKAIECSIDGGPKQVCDQPIKFDKPGPHVIKYSAVDKAGNVTPEYTYTVNVDSTKPEVAITESMPLLNVDGKVYAKKGTLFNITGSDSESGINKIMVKVDGAANFVQYIEPITFNVNGAHKIEAYSINNVGVQSDVKALDVLVDVNPPSTQIKAITSTTTKP